MYMYWHSFLLSFIIEADTFRNTPLASIFSFVYERIHYNKC